MLAKSTSIALANKIKICLAERRDKKEEEFLKSKPENKKGMISKGIIIRLTGQAKLLSDKNEEIKQIESMKKNKDQSSLSLQQDKYHALLSLIAEENLSAELMDIKSEYTRFLIELNEQHIPSNWLDDWALKAKDISFATHVAKLTHSSSKGSSILDQSMSKNARYLTTNALIEPDIDTASSNAASLPIGDILKINMNDVSVIDCLKNGDIELFEEFTEDNNKIHSWVNALKQAYDSDKKQSYFLAKQVYFPVKNDYHLLLPLTSSSIAQKIYLEQKEYFDDEQVLAREQLNKKKFNSTIVVRYPNKAKLNVTASNNSNASSFNGMRGGKLVLFSSKPPEWTKIPLSYRNKDDFFNKDLVYPLLSEIKELKKYLRLLKEKDLSDRQPVRAASVIKKVQQIIHSIFDLVLLSNQNEITRHWTLGSQLPIEYQLFFEPWRNDELANAEKALGHWKKRVSKDFARWLNRQLNKKSKLGLTPIQAQCWENIFSKELRAFIAIQEVAL